MLLQSKSEDISPQMPQIIMGVLVTSTIWRGSDKQNAGCDLDNLHWAMKALYITL